MAVSKNIQPKKKNVEIYFHLHVKVYLLTSKDKFMSPISIHQYKKKLNKKKYEIHGYHSQLMRYAIFATSKRHINVLAERYSVPLAN